MIVFSVYLFPAGSPEARFALKLTFSVAVDHSGSYNVGSDLGRKPSATVRNPGRSVGLCRGGPLWRLPPRGQDALSRLLRPRRIQGCCPALRRHCCWQACRRCGPSRPEAPEPSRPNPLMPALIAAFSALDSSSLSVQRIMCFTIMFEYSFLPQTSESQRLFPCKGLRWQR